MRTGDAVVIEDDRVLITGRLDADEINVGGNKVSAGVVRSVLQTHPRVAWAHVRGRKSPLVGNLVVAELTPGPPATVVLISGASRGLGLAMVTYLLAHDVKVAAFTARCAAGQAIQASSWEVLNSTGTLPRVIPQTGSCSTDSSHSSNDVTPPWNHQELWLSSDRKSASDWYLYSS